MSSAAFALALSIVFAVLRAGRFGGGARGDGIGVGGADSIPSSHLRPHPIRKYRYARKLRAAARRHGRRPVWEVIVVD
ncbi:hypothetical protein C8R45DRAFT_1026358 [Mycena sanguinolenta]|nr:hypothetical protein C8R45DRAFT_1026358 [Mycena sanguinolenta]